MQRDLDQLSDDELVALLSTDDSDVLGALMDRARPRLGRMLDFRLDPRLGGRFDADDVLQECFIEASTRLSEFLQHQQDGGTAEHSEPLSFFLWLRLICQQKVAQLHRRHLGVQGRDARREQSRLGRGPALGDTSIVLTQALTSDATSPTGAIARVERAEQLRVALESLPESDRELMVLRHLEGLSNREAARVLDIKESAASQRNVRALIKLREIARAHQVELTGFLG